MASEDATIRPFYLTVSLGVGHCSPSYIDLLFITEVDKRAPCELGAVVSNDCVHDPIPVYDFFDELDCRLRASCSYRLGLDPLHEFADHDK